MSKTPEQRIMERGQSLLDYQFYSMVHVLHKQDIFTSGKLL